MNLRIYVYLNQIDNSKKKIIIHSIWPLPDSFFPNFCRKFLSPYVLFNYIVYVVVVIIYMCCSCFKMKTYVEFLTFLIFHYLSFSGEPNSDSNHNDQWLLVPIVELYHSAGTNKLDFKDEYMKSTCIIYIDMYYLLK